MFGPLYVLELRQQARRTRKYSGRLIYSLLLLLLGIFLAIEALTKSGPELAGVADAVLGLITALQTIAIILVTPAYAAGSITDEKQRGRFDFLLITPLASVEIVVDKWLGQATEVLHLLSPGYFFLALLAGLWGQPLSGLTLPILEQASLIYVLAAISILASICSRSTPKALVAVYGFLGIVVAAEWILDIPLIGPSLWALPLRSDVSGVLHVRVIVCLGLLTAASLALAAWRLRPEHERQLSANTRVVGRWWDRPLIGLAPMRWKERFIGDWMSVPVWRVLPRWLKYVIFAGLIAAVVLAAPDRETFYLLGIGQIVFSGLFVALRAAGAITGERENQTWDSLLTTHMDGHQIVRGKLWGQIDAIRPYLLAYLVPALLGAAFVSVSAFLWILYTWLASWVFLYRLGAAGIASSVNATSTWQSILTTLTTGSASIIFTIGYLSLVGGAAVNSMTRTLSLAPGTAVVLLVLTSLPGLVWIFAFTEEILQQAERDPKDRHPEADRVADPVVLVASKECLISRARRPPRGNR